VTTVNEKTFNHEVLGSSIPVLASFWAPWCGVCRTVDPFLSKIQTQWDGQLKLVNINADENLRLATLYRLTTLPTVLLFDGGQLCCRFDRFCHPDDFQIATQTILTALEQFRSNYSCTA
jgi:thioredoxin 1